MPIFDRWRDDLRASRRRAARSIDEPSSPIGPIIAAVGGALGGAAVALLMDPANGRARRARLVDQLGANVRGGRRRTERMARGVAANITAVGARTSAAMRPPAHHDENDATLAARVESELFSDASIPKGGLNVNAENGIVIVRGELADMEMRERLETAIRRIPGVWEVHNLTHLPGEPAPTTR
ncbi:MAG: BON domain-containing protein [Chloroflexota bacterium]